MLPKVRIKLFLEPIDRVLEVLGGVIMVFTFTSALSVSRAGEADVRSSGLWAATSPEASLMPLFIS